MSETFKGYSPSSLVENYYNIPGIYYPSNLQQPSVTHFFRHVQNFNGFSCLRIIYTMCEKV